MATELGGEVEILVDVGGRKLTVAVTLGELRG
jgi:hypothetical protein